MSNDPGGMGAGGDVGDAHLSLSAEAGEPMAEKYLPGAGLAEPVLVDVTEVRPELADSALVDAIVAADRRVQTEVGAPLLRMEDVSVVFGGLTALDSVTFDIRRGEILGLIGPNGAGKTTAFNAMTGVYRPTKGQVRFDGQVLGKAKRNQITRLGIARTFQNIRLFNEMTALENVVVGTDARHRTSVPGALLRTRRHRQEERDAIDRSMAILEFVGVGARATEKARNLSYGEQRRLEIARALATEPKLLCLDEPAAGFNPAEKEALMDLIRHIRDDGYTVLLIEHDMRLVRGVTDRIVVLEFGKVIAEGAPEDVTSDPKVIAAYLGVPDEELPDDAPGPPSAGSPAGPATGSQPDAPPGSHGGSPTDAPPEGDGDAPA